MPQRYKEKTLSGSIVSRQYGSALIASYNRNIEEGTEDVKMRFRTVARTIDTNADTASGEKEVAPVSQLPELTVETHDEEGNLDLSGTLSNAGTDPITGADLSNISKAGVLQWMRTLFDEELDKEINS